MLSQDYEFLNEAEFKRENIAKVMQLYRKLFGKYFGGEFKIFSEEEYKKPGEKGTGIRLINDLNYQLRFNWKFSQSNSLKKVNQQDKSKLYISSIDYWEPTNLDFERPSATITFLIDVNVVQIWKGLAKVIKKGVRGKYTLKDLQADAETLGLQESYDLQDIQNGTKVQNLKFTDYALNESPFKNWSQQSQFLKSQGMKDMSVTDFKKLYADDPDIAAKADSYVIELGLGKKETNSTGERLRKADKELEQKVYSDPEYVFQDIEDMAQLVAKGKLKSLIICGQGGIGKCLTNDTDVITPNGKVKICDIKPGDEVITPKNTISKVLEVYPQQEQKDCYRVFLKDGRCVECDEEQLFKVAFGNKSEGIGEYKILSLAQIMSELEKNKYLKRKKYAALPFTGAVGSDKDLELPLDPYILGLLIGDGSLTADVGFSNTSIPTIEYFKNFLNENYPEYDLKYRSGCDYSVVQKDFIPGDKSREESKNIFKSILKDLELFGKNSHTKFIPKIYKKASVEQKKELLRGLMDTDGYIAKGSSANTSYTTASKILAQDVAEIIWSLGGRACVKEGKAKYQETYRTYYNVSFTLAKEMGQVAKCNEQKVERYQGRLKSKEYRQHLKITDIKYIGKKDTTCILIDDPDHLFLVNDYVVVHNTFHITKKLKEVLGEQPGPWYYHSGMKASPVSFYMKTFEERESIIVWDEADSLLLNDDIVMMLKPALDTSGDNTMEYSRGKSMKGMNADEIKAYSKEVDQSVASGKILGLMDKKEFVHIPGKFYFEGSMIFISNMPASKIEGAILSRSMFIDVHLAARDIQKRIMSIMHAKYAGKYSDSELSEFADAMGGFSNAPEEKIVYMTPELARKNKPVTIRSMEIAIAMKEAGLKNWARLASLYA